MIQAVKNDNGYMIGIMDSLYRLGDSVEELYNRCPNEALYIGESLRGVVSAARKYELALSGQSTPFAEKRKSSQQLSRAMTNLRYRLYECYEAAPQKTKNYYALLLEETLYSLWDPHIQHDIETYTKDQITRAFEALLAPISALDEYVSWINKRVDDISDNITILEARVEENKETLQNLRNRLACKNVYEDVGEESYNSFFIPVIMQSRLKRKRPEQKRPILTVVK